MSNPTVRFKRLLPTAVLPTRGRPGDAAFDLYSARQGMVKAGETALVSTGLASEISEGYYAQVRGRSSLSRFGIEPGGGVIDSGFRGEWVVILTNHGKTDHLFRPGDRVAQFVVLPVPVVEITEVAELADSGRGTQGFGSTGR